MVDLKLLTIPTIVGLIQQKIESFYGRVVRSMVLDAGSSWLMPHNVSSYSSAVIGARLAFYGKIVVVDSDTFKKMQA